MNTFSKMYVHNKSLLSIVDDDTKSIILDILYNMLKMDGVNPSNEFKMKLKFTLNEILNNIFRYEESSKFAIAFDYKDRRVRLSVFIPGKDMDIIGILDHIHALEKGAKDLTDGSIGLYSIKRIAQKFAINEFEDNKDYTKRIDIEFNI